MSKGGIAALSLNEKLLSAERMAVSIAHILLDSVLSPRYSALMSLFLSTLVRRRRIRNSLFLSFFY